MENDCSPPTVCKVRYSAETAEELCQVLANGQGPYLRETDNDLKETLYKGRVYINAQRQQHYRLIDKEACFECPFRV